MSLDSGDSMSFDPLMDYSAAIKQLQGGHNPVLLSLTSMGDEYASDE